VATAVPVVEVTDDADPLGVRRPDGECRSGDAVDFAEVRAEALEGAQVRTFGEQPDVHLAEHRPETIGIVGFLDAVFPGDAQAVGEIVATTRDDAFKKPLDAVDVTFLELSDLFPGLGVEHRHRQRARLHAAHPKPLIGVSVHPEDCIGVAVFGPTKRNDLCIVNH
jgi:hypothetical protein